MKEVNNQSLYHLRQDQPAQNRPAVLIIDDDPSHLQIYGWIVEAAGYGAILAEVGRGGFDLPECNPAVVLLDYHLPGDRTAIRAAQLIRLRLPAIPIILLSDAWSLPADIAPFVDGFVRKGEPATLVQALQKLLSVNAAETAGQVMAE